jgi:hypothetical protein
MSGSKNSLHFQKNKNLRFQFVQIASATVNEL